MAVDIDDVPSIGSAMRGIGNDDAGRGPLKAVRLPKVVADYGLRSGTQLLHASVSGRPGGSGAEKISVLIIEVVRLGTCVRAPDSYASGALEDL